MRKISRKTFFVSLLCILFLLSSVCADAASTKFTDIKGNWAEKYIRNVVDNGYMKGVTDTKFEPNSDMNNYDTLVGIAKVFEADKQDLAKLLEKYNDKIKKYSVPAAAQKYIAFCMEKGIISEFDLEAFQKNKLTKKKDICMYLGKAFGVKTEKASASSLAYKDAMLISDIYVPHIQYLISNGILDNPAIVGGNFNQGDTVKRGAFAKLLDTTSIAYAKKKTPGEQTGNAGSSNTGSTNENTGGSQSAAEGASVQGYFVQARPEFQNFDINLKENGAPGQKKTYSAASDITCTLNGKTIYFWDYKEGDMLTLTVANGKVTAIAGESRQKTITGILKNIELGDKAYITLDIGGGDKRLLVEASANITKDGYSINVDGLKKGNTVEALCEYDKVIDIKAKSQKTSARGVIQSITYSLSKLPSVVVKDEKTGENEEYSISTNISQDNVIILGKLSEVYSLRPGMNVSLDVENEEIIRVVTIEKSSEPVRLDATVKEVNANLALITVEVIGTDGKTAEKKVFLHKAVIRDFKELKAMDVSALKPGDKVIVTGMEEAEGIAADGVVVIR